MDIYVPKFTDLYSKDGYIELPKNKIKGQFKCTLKDEMGRIKYESDWQDNLITNRGLLHLHSSSGYGSYLLIGTSDTAPAITDTQLGSYLANVNGSGAAGYSVGPAPNYVRTGVREYTFSPGVGTGLIKEIGFSESSNGDGTRAINSHALLTTPINKGASDELTITYRVMAYNDISDTTGVLSIGGEDFNYTVRGGQFDAPQDVNSGFCSYQFINDRQYYRCYDGAIGTIDSLPSGTYIGLPDFQVVVAYGGGLGTYYSQATMDFGVDSINGKTFKSCLVICRFGSPYSIPNMAGWQFEIGRVSDNTGILKENTHTLQFVIRQSGTRYP